MLETKYLYVYIMGFALMGPLLLSFDKKVAFYQYFKPLAIATLPVATVFVLWDIGFTALGVWGFNDRYLTGISFAGLPLGEYLFFLVIPYCCIFIHQVLKAYFPKDYLQPYASSISNILIGFSLTMAVLFYDRIYTVINFSVLALSIYLFSKLLKSPWMGRFYLSFLVILIPFFLTNSLLTGSLLEEEIIWYDERYMIGIRLGTIPMEDLFYGLSQIIWTTALFEYLLKRQKKAKPAMV